MAKFYESDEFKKLNEKWQDKLAKDGFVDVEGEKERLKQYNRRTISFDDREAIRNFFMAVDSYLTKSTTLPPAHRQILELYSAGTHIQGANGIIEQTGKSDRTVRRVIKKHKNIVLKRK